jgi:hypothetical protein
MAWLAGEAVSARCAGCPALPLSLLPCLITFLSSCFTHTLTSARAAPRSAMLKIQNEDKDMVEQLKYDELLREYSVRADAPQTEFRRLRQEVSCFGGTAAIKIDAVAYLYPRTCMICVALKVTPLLLSFRPCAVCEHGLWRAHGGSAAPLCIQPQPPSPGMSH